MMSKIHIKEIYLLRSPSTCMSLHKIFYEHHRWSPRRPTGPLYMPDDQRAPRVM